MTVQMKDPSDRASETTGSSSSAPARPASPTSLATRIFGGIFSRQSTPATPNKQTEIAGKMAGLESRADSLLGQIKRLDSEIGKKEANLAKLTGNSPSLTKELLGKIGASHENIQGLQALYEKTAKMNLFKGTHGFNLSAGDAQQMMNAHQVKLNNLSDQIDAERSHCMGLEKELGEIDPEISKLEADIQADKGSKLASLKEKYTTLQKEITDTKSQYSAKALPHTPDLDRIQGQAAAIFARHENSPAIGYRASRE